MQLQGYFSDGRSTARQAVRVMTTVEGLHIHDQGGALLQSWPYKGLRLLEEVFPGQPLRLHHREMGDATLTLEDSGALATLERQAGHRLGGRPLLRPRLKTAALAGVLLVAIVIGLVLGLPKLAGPLARLVPRDWERALGERVVTRLAAPEQICSAPEGLAALERLVGRLTASARRPGVSQLPTLPHPLRVRVADLAGVNAFAAPGGQIVILKGLLHTAATPEEVAGVLAHEIAHSLENHPMQGLMRALGLQLVFAAVTGDVGSLDTVAGSFGQMLLLFSFTRSDEMTADRIGIALLNDAGIRPDGLSAFFKRMGKQESGGQGLPSIVSTHPLFEERIRQIESLAAENIAGKEAGKGPAMSPADWAALQKICG